MGRVLTLFHVSLEEAEVSMKTEVSKAKSGNEKRNASGGADRASVG